MYKMNVKKTIISLIIISFSIISHSKINFAYASQSLEACRLNAKIINVTEEYIFVDITSIKIYNKSSKICADINKNSNYKIKRDNFLKNAYRESIFVGQNVIIDGVLGNAMGPTGPVYWEEWELESTGGKVIKHPITLEEEKTEITVGNKDSLTKGQFATTTPPITEQTTKKSLFSIIWDWFVRLFRK
jgi:hypothetical protein